MSASQRKPTALVAVTDGSEDIETTCITDILRRAEVEVTICSFSSSTGAVTFARGLKVTADAHWSELTPEKEWSAIVVPGGPGAKSLEGNSQLRALLTEQKSKGKLIGAICAAPAVVLRPMGLLEGCKHVTCYPGHAFEGSSENRVEFDVDTQILTSRGVGTAVLFGLSLVALLLGKEEAEKIAKAMVVHASDLEDLAALKLS